MSSAPAITFGWLATIPIGRPCDACQSQSRYSAQSPAALPESRRWSTTRAINVAHVIGHSWLQSGTRSFSLRIGFDRAGRKAREAGLPDCWRAGSSAAGGKNTASSSFSRDKVNHPRVIHLRYRAAQLLGGDHLAGNLLDHLRPGDKHLRLPGLNNEVGQRRAVGSAARARTANQRNLRHQPESITLL